MLGGGRLKFEDAWRAAEHEQPGDLQGAGLTYRDAAQTFGVPRYWTGHVIAPTRTIGTAATASLKLSYWHSTVEDSPQASEPAFVSASLRTSAATAWRDRASSGIVSMLPFEGAQWRFEQPVSFVQFHVPFDLMGMVCGSLFERELTHDNLRMPANVLDDRLHRSMERIRHIASIIEPTNLLLDSWGLLLAEAMLHGLSTHGERNGRGSFGKIPARGIARVVDYIEDCIDQDLRLTSLANIAGMSMYHFARRFHETVGISPHAYVLARRVVRARAMLSRSDDRLAHIALACGFSSQSHFTSAFHRGVGVTPGEFRRRLQ
jgi:AraC family transcriptional regulator